MIRPESLDALRELLSRLADFIPAWRRGYQTDDPSYDEMGYGGLGRYHAMSAANRVIGYFGPTHRMFETDHAFAEIQAGKPATVVHALDRIGSTFRELIQMEPFTWNGPYISGEYVEEPRGRPTPEECEFWDRQFAGMEPIDDDDVRRKLLDDLYGGVVALNQWLASCPRPAESPRVAPVAATPEPALPEETRDRHLYVERMKRRVWKVIRREMEMNPEWLGIVPSSDAYALECAQRHAGKYGLPPVPTRKPTRRPAPKPIDRYHRN